MNDQQLEAIYGITCFGIIILLLWYVIRDALFPNIRCNSCQSCNKCDKKHRCIHCGKCSVEGFNDAPTDGNIHALSFMDVDADAMYDATLKPLLYKLTDTNYEYAPIAKGLYGGDVPSYLYTDFDDRRSSLWRVGEHGTYWPNSKMYWIDNETPKEAAQWVKKEAGIYRPMYQPTYP